VDTRNPIVGKDSLVHQYKSLAELCIDDSHLLQDNQIQINDNSFLSEKEKPDMNTTALRCKVKRKSDNVWFRR
jgi:hypothetical protein